MRPKYAGCRSALIERPDTGPARVLRCARGAIEPNHNVLQVGEWIVYCETNSHSLVAFTPSGAKLERRIRIPGRRPFVRGLAAIKSSRVLVGSQAPASVYEVELNSGRIVSRHTVAGEGEAVYAICDLPDDFSVSAPQGTFRRTRRCEFAEGVA